MRSSINRNIFTKGPIWADRDKQVALVFWFTLVCGIVGMCLPWGVSGFCD